ncbi:hypothetical protein V2L00_25410 [Pseudomonas alliivorans]|nr:hypothetical protein [Pseudomonas alliivorans]
MSVTTTERRRRERTLAWRNIIAVQGLLIESLQHPITLQAVADHLSQDGFEYVAALYDLSRTLTTLALSPSNVDPLAPGGTIVDAVTQDGFVEAKVRSANTVVRIESRLPGLIGSFGSLSINAECRLRRTHGRFDNQGMHWKTHELAEKSELPKAQRLSPEKLELFLFTPENIHATAWTSTTRHFSWAVRAQFVLTRGEEKRYLPAPAMKDSIEFDPSRTKPDFEKTNQPFWADEVSHGNTTND